MACYGRCYDNRNLIHCHGPAPPLTILAILSNYFPPVGATGYNLASKRITVLCEV
jgi:hypothetical protein